MATSIGRAGRHGVSIDCISTWDENPGSVVLTGAIQVGEDGRDATDAEVKRMLAERMRLVGYNGNYEEQIVPVRWELDETINGFYRVERIDVPMGEDSLRVGYLPFNAQLSRIAGFGSPQIESIITGAQVENSHGVVGQSWFAFPGTVKEQIYRIDCEELVYRATADGATIGFTDCGEFYSGNLRFFLTVDDFYDGACEIFSGEGTEDDPWECLVGDQIQRIPTAWMITNQLMRIVPTDDGMLQIEWWDGTLNGGDGDWTTPKTFRFFGQPTVAQEILEFTNFTILRNSPETVSVRISCLPAFLGFDIQWGALFLDLTLRRGDRVVHCVLSSYRLEKWGVGIDPAEAADTSPVGGIEADAADAEGHKWVLMSSKDFTEDLVNGDISGDDLIYSFDFGIGLEVGGDSAVSTETAQDLIDQYHSGQAERQVVVAR